MHYATFKGGLDWLDSYTENFVYMVYIVYNARQSSAFTSVLLVLFALCWP